MADKRCSKCGEVKPREAFNRSAKTGDGLVQQCKACRAAFRLANRESIAVSRAAYRAANREKLALANAEWRAANAAWCSAYRAANRERDAARRAAYDAANPGRKAAWLAANPGKGAAYSAAYRAANPEKRAEYYAANREKWTAWVAKRRATKLRATPAWAHLELVEAYYVLAAAMTQATGVKHHVDHIEPLQGRHVCGLHNEFNLQVLPEKANRAKSNLPSEVRAPACVGPVPPRGTAAWR